MRASDSQNFAFTWMEYTLGIVQGRIICSSGEFKSEQELFLWLTIESTMLKGILEKMLLTIDVLVPILAGRSQSDARDLSTEAKSTSSKPESNQNQKGQPMLMTMPIPPPEPIPGGGPQDGYQFAFNENYYKTRRKELQPFFYGRPGAEAGTELTQDERVALANSLYHADPRVPFDEQIDFEGEDSYETMYQRKVVFGYDRVPYGQGTDGPVVPVDDSDFKGPVVPGYLPVSLDIADFKAS